MKKLLILALAWTMVACDSDTVEVPGDFAGTDNYIVSFSLTKDGVTYPAVINGDKITVAVRHDISLDGAVAEVTLSENCTISPDPTTISAWDKSWQFMTTSYAQQDKVYLYEVERQNESSDGDVMLTTQQEVAAFATTGVNVIEGNLTLGKDSPSDPITDLTPLSGIKEITGNLIVKRSFEGESLKALTSLTKAGGFYFGTETSTSPNHTLADIELPALEEITTDIYVNSTVTERLALPVLKSIGGNFNLKADAVSSIELPSLETIGGTLSLRGTTGETAAAPCEYIEFPMLTEVTGRIEITLFPKLLGMPFAELTQTSDLAVTSCTSLLGLSFPKFTQTTNIVISSCPAMTTCSCPAIEKIDNLTVSKMDQLESIEMPALKTIDGTFSLSEAKVLTTCQMPALKSVAKDIVFTTLVNGDGLAGMPALEEIGGKLSLKDVGGIESLDLSRISVLSGTVEITGNSFNSMRKLHGPAHYTGNITLSADKYLTSFPEVSGFNEIDGNFTMSAMTAVVGAVVLDGPEKINGSLSVNNIGKADASLTGQNYVEFRNLKTVRTLTIAHSVGVEVRFPQLTTIGTTESGSTTTLTMNYTYKLGAMEFPALETIYGKSTISVSPANRSTTDMHLLRMSFPKLTTIEGDMNIFSSYKNAFITDLRMDALQKLTGKLTLKGMPELKDFSSFKKLIPNITGDQWSVTDCGYDPDYDAMMRGEYTKPDEVVK